MESPFKLATELSLCRCQSTFDTFSSFVWNSLEARPNSRPALAAVALMRMPALSRAGTAMADDPTREHFAGTDRDRAAFEAGIKLGSIVHQYVGMPLTSATVPSLERAIEAATRVQPLVERVRVRIDQGRMRIRGPYKYGALTEDLLDVEVSVRVGTAWAVGALRFVPELDYPLMYLKEIGGPTKD